MDLSNDSLLDSNIPAFLCKLGLENYTIFCPNHSQPKDQALRILLYSLIFLLSVLGNTLVIVVLIRNKRMRTVTNIFLLSLAISDLMLCFFCMPFTLIPNLLEDFIFGIAFCKLTSYFMAQLSELCQGCDGIRSSLEERHNTNVTNKHWKKLVNGLEQVARQRKTSPATGVFIRACDQLSWGVSVSVSTFSLVAISLERYGAICKPLQSRVWQTKSHALKVIAATWGLSFAIMTPYPIYSTLKPIERIDNSTANMCRLHWPYPVVEQSWYIFQLLILFLIPGIIMIIAYGLISLELYQGIKFDVSQRKYSRERKTSTSSKFEDSDGCYLQKSKKKKKMPLQQFPSNRSISKIDRPRSNCSTANLMAKKLVIRMLIVIVILFFVCWTPVFSVNTWRAFDKTSAQLLLTGAPISFIHLLSYTSACVNPIIYCFMNKRFRMGFLATFTCCAKQKLPVARAEMAEEEEGRTTGATLSRYSYTHMNASAPP
ncbi:cholecystokinin receptor type A [Podarcis lilfordi]|uniref:Cholecystokinin receptor type A n=1 Tax=Podarcis lilfordi TaxID=74358 RepID=A0AA35KSY7_9SAUR|nr:cholecystokinin receptor type A [Podarcis lilfordi]